MEASSAGISCRCLVTLFVRYRLGDVNHSKQHEQVGLNDSDAEVQAEKDHWHAKRYQREEHHRQQVAGKHVGVKTNRERQNTGEVRNDLDRKQQPRYPPDWAKKMLQVANRALCAHSVEVVVNEREQGHA